MSDRRALVPFAVFSAGYFAHVGFINPYLPLWLQGMGLNLLAIGLLTALQPATRLFAPYAWGWLSDHTGHRVWLLRYCAFTAGLSSLLLWLPLPLLALALVLLRPQRLLAGGQSADALPITPRLHLLMVGVGFWTGLIVLDAATYLLVGLVLVGGVALQQANAIKAVLIGLASLASLAVFARGGEVHWAAALPLMLGSALGGWLGASLALGPRARQWIMRLLILALSSEVAWMLVRRIQG